MNPVLDALFGNRTAACVLLFLQCYGEGHAQRIAKTFGFGLNMAQQHSRRLGGGRRWVAVGRTGERLDLAATP